MRIRLGETLLGNRDMRLFLAAQGLDSLAIGVAGVALPWLLLSEGHSVGLAGLVGADRVVYGTDYPFDMAAGPLADQLAGTGIGDAGPIASGNANDLFGLGL